MAKYCSIIFLLIILVFVCHANAAEKNIVYSDVPRVILITISGVRNEDTITDPTHQYIPYLSENIFKKGCLYTSLVDLNYQFHMPAVSAMRTGRTYGYSSKLKRHKVPSIFQYIRKQLSLSSDKVWAIGDWIIDYCSYETEEYSKETFPCVITSLHFKMSPETKSLLVPHLTLQEKEIIKNYAEMGEGWPQWDSVGDVQFLFFKKVMKEIKPLFVHYLMNDVESAHYDTRARYLLAIKRVDEKIKHIWDFIHADKFYSGKTYLIIAPDHTRNLYYMDHSEGFFNKPWSTWLYIYGPDIKSGFEVEKIIHHVDVFSTIAWLYGVDVHENYGTVLEDAFRNKKQYKLGINEPDNY